MSVITLLTAVTLVVCGNNDSKESTKSENNKTESLSKPKKEAEVTFKDDVFTNKDVKIKLTSFKMINPGE